MQHVHFSGKCYEADNPYTNLTIFLIFRPSSMDFNVHRDGMDGMRIYSKIILTILGANTIKFFNSLICSKYERVVRVRY